uniref:protein-serine/threonine phosphatase n=1 Tax=Opuntia streptacantha TaxID=393608 RepID=A0A7C8ZAN4_OPUST
MLVGLCGRPLKTCFGFGFEYGDEPDELLWHGAKLTAHAFGEYSMAVVQANSMLEDQAQVLSSSSATSIGVFDGHGGPAAARFINTHLFSFLLKFASEQGGMSADALRKAYYKTEEGFLQFIRRSWLSNPQIAISGSCCLAGTIYNGTLYIANLGDSRAVLGRRVSDDGVLAMPPVVAERLTSDHNVGNVKVRQEVRALHPDDKQILVYSRGYWRIKGIIQVSRSIGDVYLKRHEFSCIYQKFGSSIPLKRAVITAEPSISVRKLNVLDQFVIFASDGFWEHISDGAAVEMVYKSPRFGIAGRLARAAVEEAARRARISYEDVKKIEKGLRRHFHDDITVIVVYLDDIHSTLNCDISKDQGAYASTITPANVVSFDIDEADSTPGSIS